MANDKKKNVFNLKRLFGIQDKRQKAMDKQMEGLFGKPAPKDETKSEKQKRLNRLFGK